WKGGVGLSLLEIVFVFLFVDMFDNIGTLVAVTKKAGLIAPDGSIPRMNRILLSDSTAMLLGALVGTSPVTSYIESAAGVAVGARTGLTSVVVGMLFLATLFFAPLVQAIPTAATAPALILVGALMMGALAEIDWADPGMAIPAFLTVIIIPLTYSIANGLAFGITSHAILKLVRGQARPGDWLVYLLAALGRRDVVVAQGPATVNAVPFTQRKWASGATDTSPARDAIEFISEQAHKRPGEITLVALAPLSNIEALARRDPEALHELRQVVMMGGSIHAGYNQGGAIPVAEPSAEYNVASAPGGLVVLLQ